MKERKKLKVGEEILVFDTNGTKVGQPEGGWVGQVISVGPKYITVKYPGGSGVNKTTQFGVESWRNHTGFRQLRTREEHILVKRRAQADVVLREHKVYFGTGNTFTLEQIEQIAKLIGTFPKTERD